MEGCRGNLYAGDGRDEALAVEEGLPVPRRGASAVHQVGGQHLDVTTRRLCFCLSFLPCKKRQGIGCGLLQASQHILKSLGWTTEGKTADQLGWLNPGGGLPNRRLDSVSTAPPLVH